MALHLGHHPHLFSGYPHGGEGALKYVHTDYVCVVPKRKLTEVRSTHFMEGPVQRPPTFEAITCRRMQTEI